jgi:GTP-binding protein
MFIDEATVRVRGGCGGNGTIHFVSNRHNPRGGPDGGTGGHGGGVILRASPSVSTLHSFRNRPLFAAADGANGAGNSRHGGRGEDRVVLVPVGTVIRDALTEETIADLANAGDEIVVARGGEGGRGNGSFVTSTRQAPRICERGLPGERRALRLELKLIADVGIIGYPNVGKSSLISAISSKKAKVADYPFTTITPNLGVVDVDGRHQFVAVDIPGLVEGAHEGRGLGDRFLRHVERTLLFIHMVDLASLGDGDPVEDFRRINEELGAFNPALLKRPQIVAGNKIDLMSDEDVADASARFRDEGIVVHPISVATRAGLQELVLRTHRELERLKGEGADGVALPIRRKTYRFHGETGFRVDRNGDRFIVSGEVVENLVRKLVLDSRDAMEYMSDRLEKMGVIKELRKQGFTTGDTVQIGEVEFELER